MYFLPTFLVLCFRFVCRIKLYYFRFFFQPLGRFFFYFNRKRLKQFDQICLMKLVCSSDCFGQRSHKLTLFQCRYKCSSSSVLPTSAPHKKPAHFPHHAYTQVDPAATGPTYDRFTDTTPTASPSHMSPGAAGVRNVKYSFTLCCEE